MHYFPTPLLHQDRNILPVPFCFWGGSPDTGNQPGVMEPLWLGPCPSRTVPMVLVACDRVFSHGWGPWLGC